MGNHPKLVALKPMKQRFRNFSVIKLDADEFTLGRSLENSAVIAFVSLSRKHCVFRRKSDDTWTIEDMSAFGVCLNSKKLTKGCEHQLSNKDTLQLEPTGEFIYQFLYEEDTINEPPNKKSKSSEHCEDILKDAKQMFEDSQCFEVENLEKKIKNAQKLQNTSILMKEQLELEMEQKVKELNEGFEMQIENLKGEKQEVERQKIELEKERDAKLLEMRNEMDEKIDELKQQITKHTESEKSLLEENNSLKERLEKERQQFLGELREAAGREEALQQLQERCRLQEETRLRERQVLEESLRRETEQLKIALQQIEARAEAERKLREDKENTEKNLENLRKQVIEKEIEMNIRAEQRVQEEALKSKQKVTILQEELDKVKTELECEKIVRLFTSEVCDNLPDTQKPGPSSEGPEVRTQFGELLESELQCTICADLLIQAVTLNCSHTFCKYCINEWKKKKKECPICRSLISSECRSLVIDSFIEKMVENLSENMKTKRLQVLKDREELELQSRKGQAGTSRGRGSGSESGSNSGSNSGSGSGSGAESESDASSAWGLDEDEYNSDFYVPDDYEYYHHRAYYRPPYFDYDSGSDSESYDDDAPPAAAVIAAAAIADGNTGGGPSNEPARVGSGAGAASSRRRATSRNNTTTRSRPRQAVAGIPGSYYGGYGRCFNCGARGHWAPGCPFNLI